MRDYGGFDHNDQALRVVTRLETRYAGFDGLNLTWETLEGLVKHNGPLLPLRDGKALPVTISAYRQAQDLELHTHASLEAQVAALADDIAYNTHDIEDGLRAGFFVIEELAGLPLVGDIVREVGGLAQGLEPARTIHEMTRRLIDRLVKDAVTEIDDRINYLRPGSAADVRAAGRPLVALSPEMASNEKSLRRFLNERLYHDYRVNRMTSKARRVVADLFQHFMAEPETLPTPWQLTIGREPGDMSGRARIIADYIAGMTDRFAIAEHRRLFDFYERQL
jgi:dGTPase